MPGRLGAICGQRSLVSREEPEGLVAKWRVTMGSREPLRVWGEGHLQVRACWVLPGDGG